MSLQVWLPLNGDLHNQGLNQNVTLSAVGNPTIENEGKIGKCYAFDGSSYFQSQENFLTGMTECSLACWVKDTYTGNSWMRIFGIGEHTRVHLDTNGAAGQVRFFVSKDGSTGQYWGPIGKTNLKDSTWHHVCGTFDSQTCKIYIDGKCEATVNTGSLPTTTGGKLYLAHVANGVKLNGSLNDIRVYDHCLSAKEVEEIAKGLILHYKLDSISNPNLFTSIKSHNPTQYLGYQLYISEKLTTDTYTVQLWDVNVSHTGKAENEIGIGLFWGGGTLNLTNKIGTKYFKDGHADYLCFQIKPTSAQVSNSNASNLWLNIYNSPGDKSGTRNMSIGAWKLEKGDVATPLDVFGTMIYDSSGYNNNGTIIGNLTAAAGSPRYDVATDFSASGTNYIRIGTQLYNVKDEMTISLWAKANDWTSTAKGTPFSSVEAGGFGWQVSNANYVFYCGTGASSNTYVSSTVAVSGLSAGWHMLSATYDGLALRIYIDGELKNTVSKYTTKTPIFYNNSSGMFISGESAGNVTSPNGSIFRGSISDVRIYATALTADQIKEFYTTSMSIDSSGNVYAREFKEQ